MTNRERAEELATAIIAGRMCESFQRLAERLEIELGHMTVLEREACAVVADFEGREGALNSVEAAMARDIAIAIRARAKVTP